MTRPWDADVDIAPALAVRLIESQFPELAPARVEPLARGWDSVAFAVNDGWVFRFPRRRPGAEAMANEIRWLPAVARPLPARVSIPEKVGRAGEGGPYPYPFAGYRAIEGETACRARVNDPIARDLGELLAALHRVAVPPDAPGDAIGRADMPGRFGRLAEPLSRLAARGYDLSAARDRMRSLSRGPPWDGVRLWVHGDLYARHVVVADGRLAGVIDWGDLHAGDPALDLSLAFSLFEGGGRDVLLAAYGPVDAATLDRARFRALYHGVLLLDYGVETGDAALVEFEERALRRART